MICVFWDIEPMNWSRDGCNLISNESFEDYSICECDKLGNFAAILDISERYNNSWIDNLIGNNISNFDDVDSTLILIKKMTRSSSLLNSFHELAKLVHYLAFLQDFVHSDNSELFKIRAYEISLDFLLVYDNLIMNNNAWITANVDEKIKIALKILLYIQYSSFILNRTQRFHYRPDNIHPVVRNLKNIFSKVYVIHCGEKLDFAFNDSSIKIPVGINLNGSTECLDFGVGYHIKGLGKYLSGNMHGKRVINSEIIAFSFLYTSKINLIDNNLKVRFR
jgi:hypothetical protein